MKKIIKKKLEEIFLLECSDQTRYLAYAEKAKEEGHANIARLFHTIAYSERIQAKRFLKFLGELGNSRENLLLCLENEKYQSEEFYPALFELAGMMNEADSLSTFYSNIQTETVHVKLFEKALESLHRGEDIYIDKIYICSNCGFTMEGTANSVCSGCGLSSTNFKEF